MELFEYRPINFLLKPLDKTKMKKVLEKYLKITRQNEQIFTYKKRFEVYHVPLSDILYFESKGRKVTIAARNGRDEFYGTLKEIKERIQDRCFLWIHKSILVNYRYITKLKYDQAEMTDGAILQISQSDSGNSEKIYGDTGRGGEMKTETAVLLATNFIEVAILYHLTNFSLTEK